MNKITTPMDDFLTYLKNHDYKITPVGYDCYRVESSSILGYYNLDYDLHPAIDFRFGFDNIGCFNKIGQCPVSYDILSGNIEDLDKWLKFVASDEGLNWSESFDYLNDDTRPMVNYTKEK